jgi:hypothetical protein
MELNPYAKNLGDRDPLEVIRGTTAALQQVVERMPKQQLEVRPPGKRWNAREIVCHLGDCDLAFGFRMKQALAMDSPVVQPFDQERWALRYGNVDMASALAMFAAARQWNLLLIEGTTAEERARPMTHPERGTMTFWTIVETMGGHDVNHLLQLERIANGE